MCRKQTKRGVKYEKINNYFVVFGKYIDDCCGNRVLLSSC